MASPEHRQPEGGAVQPLRAGEHQDDDAQEDDLAEIDRERPGEHGQRVGTHHALHHVEARGEEDDGDGHTEQTGQSPTALAHHRQRNRQ